jgi:hypothetical protein
MADAHKYQAHEVLNRVLNSGEDALKVDIDNVTLTTEGGDVAIEVHLDKAEDSVLMFSNTSSDGSGTSYVPLVDSSGHLQVDALSSALPSGAATAANQSTIIGHVDGVETLLGTIDSDTDAIKTSLDNIDNAVDGNYLNVNMNLAGSDAQAGEGTISATTQRVTIATDDDGVAHLATIAGAVSTQMQVDIVADGAGLATDANLALMLYGTALAVTAVHGGSDHSLGATYEAFYIGVGGDVSLDCVTSGTNIVFKNLASGQMLPVRATVVNATNTTATNIVALKA